MGWINNQEVLGKLRQVMNEVLELKAEESARSTELIKQMDALNEKVVFLSAKMSEANAKIAGLNTRVDDLNQHAGTLEGFIKNGVTKPMMEMLGKKVNEIGKTVDDHFESFVKVSEKDTELFKLIAQAMTGKMVEDEASAEPKLTEKAKKNERRKTKKNEGAKEAASEAKTTVSGTDGNSGKERKTVVIEGKIGISKKKNFFGFSIEIEKFLKENGFKFISYPKDNFKELSFRKTMNRKEKFQWFVKVEDGLVFDSRLTEDLEKRFGNSFGCVLRCNSHYCKLSFKK